MREKKEKVFSMFFSSIVSFYYICKAVVNLSPLNFCFKILLLNK